MYLVWKCPFKEETISFVLVLYSVHLQHATPPPLGAVTLRCAQLFAVAPLFWAMPHPPVVWQAVCYAFPCHQYSTQQVNSPLRSDQSSSVCVYTVVRTQHPGGFPPAGATKGAAHRRCDCRAYSKGGCGRNRRENIRAWSMCRSCFMSILRVEWLLGYCIWVQALI